MLKQYADITILYQLALELKLNYLLGRYHKPIIALLIAHLICKGSILRISRWIENSTIKEVIGLDELTTECCMMLWIIWMNVILTLLSKVFLNIGYNLILRQQSICVRQRILIITENTISLHNEKVKMVKFQNLFK